MRLLRTVKNRRRNRVRWRKKRAKEAAREARKHQAAPKKRMRVKVVSPAKTTREKIDAINERGFDK